MDYLIDIINTTLESFDFAYCIVVNILTYVIIKIVGEATNKGVKTWIKRVILLACILLTGVLYYATGQDVKLIINSGILATVSWDIVFKPLCKKVGIDYKKVDKDMVK